MVAPGKDDRIATICPTVRYHNDLGESRVVMRKCLRQPFVRPDGDQWLVSHTDQVAITVWIGGLQACLDRGGHAGWVTGIVYLPDCGALTGWQVVAGPGDDQYLRQVSLGQAVEDGPEDGG